METMRESWTDERLDDLRGEVADLRGEMADFRGETKEEFVTVRQEMRDEFRAVRREMSDEFRAVRAEMSDGFNALDRRFDNLQRMMIQFQALLIAALIGLIATQL